MHAPPGARSGLTGQSCRLALCPPDPTPFSRAYASVSCGIRLDKVEGTGDVL